VFLPRVTFEADPFGFRSRNWRLILQRPVNAKLVVIILEIRKFHFQICRRPKQKMVEAFSTNGSDQSFNKRMREGNERYCFDFRYAEDSQVRLPLMESIQGIIWNSPPTGGTGVVFRAHDIKLQPDVALKFQPDHFANDPDTFDRVQRNRIQIPQRSGPEWKHFSDL
jgi:hypothetical protein